MWGGEIRRIPLHTIQAPEGMHPLFRSRASRSSPRRPARGGLGPWLAALALGPLGLAPAPAPVAPQGIPWDLRGGLPVGSEAERYLRVLQVAGLAPAYPWTLRGITPGEVKRVLPEPGTPHPWQARYDFSPGGLAANGYGWVQPEGEVIYNSAFPFGENDGALWAGKGVTGAARAGGWARFGRLHLRLAPELFWAENGEFELAPNGWAEEKRFLNAHGAKSIDHPQRFGEAAYTRADPGSSALALELPGITVGASGAAQWWGPAQHYPLMLGSNAGGFLHAFAQTAEPVSVGIARVHLRLIGGRMDQSDFSPRQTGELRRFASAAVLVLLPRGLDGLEVGATRFSERIWPAGGIGLGEVLRPFADPISVPGDEANLRDENQMAGAFLRWALPRGGFELYGEILREDFARDLRHYLVEPDDLMARTFGFQKVWAPAAERLVALRGEVVSSEVHHSERGDRFRDGRLDPRPMPRYQHGGVPQGHTQYGQILGSPTAYGGSGWTLGVDVYDPGGRWSLDLSRALRLDWLREGAGPTGANRADVVYAVKGEVARFRGGYEWRASLVPAFNLNRNLEEGNDLFNLNVAFSVRGLPW